MLRTTIFCRFNCPLITVAFILTLLECLVINVHSQNTTTSDIRVGTSPKYIELPIGGNGNITCHTLEHHNISTIWFWEKNHNTNITQPNEQIIIINSTTALLRIKNVTEDIFEYQCMNGEHAVGAAKVYVGTPPTRVKDFSCRGYDFEYLTCSFTKPKNNLRTNYTIKYKGKSSEINTCSNLTTDEMKEKMYCNLTGSDLNINFYAKVENEYEFNITGKNALNETTQTEIVKNLESIIPAKLNIEIINKTTDSVKLFWKIKTPFYSMTNTTLIYEICFKPKNFNTICTIYTSCKSMDCYFIKDNLPYAGYEYSLSARAKVIKGKDDMWSEPFNITFQTLPKAPNRPPKTEFGSFYINSMLKLHLYWEQLEDYEHNGPDFHYTIREADSNGTWNNFIQQYNKTYTSMIELKYNNSDHERVFFLKSSNSYGESSDFSIIRVPANIKDDNKPTSVSKVYNANTYNLSWKPPKGKNKLISYTVFWCTSQPETFDRCKDSIKFTIIDKNLQNFITEPQDRTLNLAVSANYIDFSTGMHWAYCTADVNVDLIKVVPEVKLKTSNSIELKWSSDRICSSIVKGYNLTYCQIQSNSSTECLMNSIQKPLPGDLKTYTIQNLKPYSKYRINMIMYSNLKIGPENENPLIEETKEAAPTIPRDLKLIKTTSNSANLSWLPPKVLNGKLRKYIIRIKSEHRGDITDRELEVNTEHNSNQRINYTLDSLSSYTEYFVSVIARTVNDSMPSNEISFKTMIGIPTTPRNVRTTKDNLNGFISWADPEMLSGRLEFYVVAMTIRIGEKTIINTALVNGHKCSFRFPDCQRPIPVVQLKVRAVNFANESEIDHEIFSATNESKNGNDIDKMDFECEGSTALDARYLALYKIDENDAINVQYTSNGKFSFYSSLWKYDEIKYEIGCDWDRSFIIYYVAITIIMIFIAFATLSILKKYKKMKNIQVVLPAGLVGTTIYSVEHKKDITGSKDCLIINKEHLRLLTTQRQNSINQTENDITISEDSNNINRDEQNAMKAVDYLESRDNNSNGSSCDEQYSSRSTDSIDMNDMNYINDIGSWSNTKNSIQNKDIDVEEKIPVVTIVPNNVVTNEQINTNLERPVPATNGYVSFDVPNGYVQADNFRQKPTVACDPISKSQPIQIEDNLESDLNKSNSPQINNNMYVTQQQLAEFARITCPK